MEYLIKSTLVLTVFYICYFLFLRKETFFNHNRWFLLGGLIIAMLFPFVIIPVHVSVEPQSFSSQLINYTEQLPASVETHTTFDWTKLITGIYLTGLSIFLIQFLFQFGSLIWLLLTNPKNKDGIYTYVIVTNNVSPFSFFKWIVYNPDAFNDNELALMLTHEKVHASQLHSLDIIFTHLVCSIFWFNPLMWLYRKDIRQNLEYIADYKTQSITKNTKKYQHLLLKTSVAHQKVSLSTNFYNSLIKERIVMLQKSRSNKRKQWKYLLMLPVLAGLLMSMNTETVYVPSEDYMTMDSNSMDMRNNEHIEIIFSKNTSDKQLEQIKEELKSNGITMTVKSIKRNIDNEIIQIDIDFKTENGSANYNVVSDKGIKPFKFSKNDSGSFGVGPINDKEVVILEVAKYENDTQDNNVFIFKEGNEDEVVKIKEDSGKVYKIIVKTDSDFTFKEPKLKKGLNKKNDGDYEVIIEKEYGIDTSTVKKIIKTKTDNYFEEDKEIIIENEDDTIEILRPGTTSRKGVSVFSSGKNQQPIILINDKIVSDIELETINPKSISNVNVLKGDEAVKTYGDKAKNGVIVIRLKDNNFKYLNKKETGQNKKVKTKIIDYDDDVEVEWTEKSETEQEGPWKIKTGISGYTFISDDDMSKNATLGIITKDTPDSVLETNKASLEDLGISVKYSKLKRNKLGKITSIKITLKNDNGKQSSASYKDDDGIGDIEYGVMGDKLIVRSRN
ncbi:M56 family metallopeptidase [Winogradskyella alexanderae]|uniref:M56 family metallopeptidase n=1 Tax=Winogradskyella alexanderae TaxID=2877123 RepID=A0ABS7XUP6_9FLAO|nr:M56 family metallopeptidase [Winogradskyella alexanderae]MCA0133744.1 M56 family metallopeptidase [Winogradskyella alexanderae]